MFGQSLAEHEPVPVLQSNDHADTDGAAGAVPQVYHGGDQSACHARAARAAAPDVQERRRGHDA